MAVGANTFRIDGIEKVTGQAKFTSDLSFPDLLEAKILRSPFPHAMIESIDASEAEILPGVCAVLTRADLKDIDPFYGNCFRDRPILALDRVRFVGEPVAVVAAENTHRAQAAVTAIEVRYRELPCLATVESSLADGAMVLHETVAGIGEFHDIAGLGRVTIPNICHQESYENGDIAHGFGVSDHIIEETFQILGDRKSTRLNSSH